MSDSHFFFCLLNSIYTSTMPFSQFILNPDSAEKKDGSIPHEKGESYAQDMNHLMKEIATNIL
jgi:hypothetical protein